MSATQYNIPACTIQPLRDGIAVLRALFSTPHPLGPAQIAKATGIEYSQVEKLAYTLQIERLVECDRLEQWSIHSDGVWAALDEGQT